MRKPCKLFFNFLCNSFFFAHPGLGGTAGIALDSQWDGYSFSNLKWKQQQRSCPALRQTLPSPHVSQTKLEAMWDCSLPVPLHSSIPRTADTPFCCCFCTLCTSSTDSFIFSPAALLHLRLVTPSKPSSCLISASDFLLTISSVSSSLSMIQVYFSLIISQNGWVGVQTSSWCGSTLIFLKGFPFLCSFVHITPYCAPGISYPDDKLGQWGL